MEAGPAAHRCFTWNNGLPRPLAANLPDEDPTAAQGKVWSGSAIVGVGRPCLLARSAEQGQSGDSGDALIRSRLVPRRSRLPALVVRPDTLFHVKRRSQSRLCVPGLQVMHTKRVIAREAGCRTRIHWSRCGLRPQYPPSSPGRATRN